MGQSSPEVTGDAGAAEPTPEGRYQFAFEAFGVPVTMNLESIGLLGQVEGILPPGWQRREPREGDQFFTLERRTDVGYVVEHGEGAAGGSSDLAVALAVLETNLRLHVAANAPDHIFVHAGVVGFHGKAIVIPSRSFGGKTTLVRELMRAGALYYSDEFAVLDAEGRVHPYPKPLSIRLDGLNQVDHDIAGLGGKLGTEPLRVAAVALTYFEPGTRWEPRRLSTGEAVLGLLENTLPAQDRPEQSLATLKRALDGAAVLEGPRGEASEMAGALLEYVGAGS
jgi:hypothetical protein